jgi:hypothetical protein
VRRPAPIVEKGPGSPCLFQQAVALEPSICSRLSRECCTTGQNHNLLACQIRMDTHPPLFESTIAAEVNLDLEINSQASSVGFHA